MLLKQGHVKLNKISFCLSAVINRHGDKIAYQYTYTYIYITFDVFTFVNLFTICSELMLEAYFINIQSISMYDYCQLRRTDDIHL